jgi:hypothetical protein
MKQVFSLYRLNLKKRIFRICALCIVWFIWNSVYSGLGLDMLSININFMWVRFMGYNETFNNISVISWQSVLLVEQTGVSGENH